MPINWEQAQIKPGGVIGSLPGSSGGSGMGGLSDLLNGVGGLLGGLKQGSQPTQIPPGGPTYQGGTLGNSVQNMTSPYQTQQGGLQQSLDSKTQLKPYALTDNLTNTPAFQTAFKAHQEAIKTGVTNSPLVTVIDYSKPANTPRMWVVDTTKNQVLLNTYVAQGKTPGFSNTPESHQSSLGTFKTGNIYQSQSMGKQALKIEGLEQGINDKAFARGIVVHGGNYVGPDKQGTSWGCFTVPNQVAPALIGLTKNGTIIHAYAPDQHAVQKFNSSLATTQGQETLSRALQNPNGSSNPRYDGMIGNPNQVKPNIMNPNSNFNYNFNQPPMTVPLGANQTQNSPRNGLLPNSLNNNQNPSNTNLASNQQVSSNTNLSHIMSGIAGVESPGEKNPYILKSIPSRSGDRAYGKYQIMGKNIPAWTKEAGMNAMSPQQFLNSPEAQEKVVQFKINQLIQKGYSPEDIASIWFSGRTAKKAGNAKDAYGTSVPQYIKKFQQFFMKSKNNQSLNDHGTYGTPPDNTYPMAPNPVQEPYGPGLPPLRTS